MKTVPVGSASLCSRYALDSRLRGNDSYEGRAEGQSPFAEGLGVSPNLPIPSPKIGGSRGLKASMKAVPVGSVALLTLRAGFRSHNEAWPSEGEAVLRPYGNGSFI